MLISYTVKAKNVLQWDGIGAQGYEEGDLLITSSAITTELEHSEIDSSNRSVTASARSGDDVPARSISDAD